MYKIRLQDLSLNVENPCSIASSGSKTETIWHNTRTVEGKAPERQPNSIEMS